MDRRLQFGMRENPASDRRHGSRHVVTSNTSRNSVGEEDAEASDSAVLGAPLFGGPHSSEHSAPLQAATVERREEAYGAASPIRRHDQVPARVASDSYVPFEPLLDIVDAAKLLRIHPKTLRAKAARGIIPGIQIGRVWRFRASMLDQWLTEITNRGTRR